jgi:hypothetical protein
MGAPNTEIVHIGTNFNGTLVAPRAHVITDLTINAMVRGSFFVRRFELHQGRTLQWVPFSRAWIPTCAGGGFTGCA